MKFNCCCKYQSYCIVPANLGLRNSGSTQKKKSIASIKKVSKLISRPSPAPKKPRLKPSSIEQN